MRLWLIQNYVQANTKCFVFHPPSLFPVRNMSRPIFPPLPIIRSFISSINLKIFSKNLNFFLTRFHELNGDITEISYECKSTEAVVVSKLMAGVFESETSPVKERSRGTGRGRGWVWQRKLSPSPLEDAEKFISK